MSRRLTDRAIPSALLIGLMMACNGDGGTEPTPTPTLASITVSTSTAVLAALDQTSQFNATALDGSGNIMSGVAFTWNSSNDDVASVSGSGLVTAEANGTADITASASGVSGSATVTVSQAVTQAAFTVPPANWSAGVAFTPDLVVELRDANGHVAVNSADAVTLSVGVNPNSGTLAGPVARTAQAGVTTFPGIAMDNPGVGYTIVATSSGASVESPAFNLTLPSVYVTHGNSLSVISTATNTVVATVSGVLPRNLAITPDGLSAYVLDFGASTVSVFETATNTITATIEVGLDPEGIAIAPDGTRAYVANYSAGTVSVIATESNTVAETISVSGLNSFLGHMVLTPDGGVGYVMAFARDSVAVISTASNTVVDGISFQDGRPPEEWGQNPYRAAMHPDGEFLYVANRGSEDVFVVSTASNTVTDVIEMDTELRELARVPGDIAISPDGSFAYVTHIDGELVSVIDTENHTITNTIPPGPFSGPAGVAFGPAGDVAYVVNTGSGEVSVIDTSSHTVVASIPVAAGAEFLAVMPAPNR